MISVLIATRDRCEPLRETLEALCLLERPQGGWQLVVIDNGSRDRTAETLHSFQGRLPLSVLNEPRPGKNAALNTALGNLAGDIVVFTDDDVTPNPDWLQAMRAVADIQTEASMIGGVVKASWEAEPPEWLLKSVPLSPNFAVTDAHPDGPVNPRLVFGPNMAIRATVFDSGYRFNEQMGPHGEVYAQGGETELLIRLGNNGHTAWHTTSAIVQHRIRATQLQRSWLLHRAVRFGRGEHRLARLHSPDACGSPTARCTAAALAIAAQFPRTVFKRLVGTQEEILREQWQLYYRWGGLRESLDQLFRGGHR